MMKEATNMGISYLKHNYNTFTTPWRKNFGEKPDDQKNDILLL